MTAVSRARPFDPRPARAPRQWPLGVAVLMATVLNAIVWGGLLAAAKTLLHP
ncbi:hypothetical protein [uncultured Caulobacter sp.]|uniref:hypothetical protein n=1 Tax=uncultured Caulobacter sp. TaxID=158749 RepID=UPI002613F47F|nr:hypothetical protein [uncultured Caulobacter sp.]